ncbi:MAG: hypothetical protein NZM37_10335 [Sandaracinaceae bacterium]|nr:hypothetical protein [Sandaracinaceae bacterium]MDW8247577.1 hypothetical protein [Sandaracinaceae bacterium]
MKVSEARRLAMEYSLAQLDEAIRALMAESEPPFPVAGEDHGDRLTQVLLARRMRERIEQGEDPHTAFRAVVSQVRSTIGSD